ncbi:uncharacterized protein DNG_05846 [Cephalotrichum gorgonifer]|uniref:Glucose-methanol-choline oxidoreductase N-terminal domain-containing protein n=1 Tax=Cephalotrichum gorgonifer TaxID=2041049 RepID=A0AAE8SW30_9PEZI|nr:uncharacterized protein DNG_05846 [Cephalotrichum gorgonifer]
MQHTLSILATVLAVSAVGLSAGIIRNITEPEDSYDYIIAGGGLSGLVVASRLTEDPDVSVLVVEYGDFDDSLNVDLPFYSKTMQIDNVFFHTSVPQVGLNNRITSLASSTLTLPSDELVARYEYALSSKGFGDGPVQVSLPSWQWPETYTYIDAFEDAGIHVRTNGGTEGSNVGLHWNPSDIDPVNGTRSSSRRAYWDPASGRPNLSIIVNTFVSTINLDNTTATGVNIINRVSKEGIPVRASREVILAAGAAHTPQILQLSGIGPRDLLENLVTNDTELNPRAMNDPEFLADALEEYWENKTGPITHTGKSCRVMLNLHNLSDQADSIIAGLEGEDPTEHLSVIYTQSEELRAGYKAQHTIMTKMIKRQDVSVFEHTFGGGPDISFHPQKPFSRGTIRITGTDPHPAESPVSIDFRAMTHPLDMKIAILGLKFGRMIMASDKMGTLGALETAPGPDIVGDEELEELFRSRYVNPSNAHPVGTTSMMPRELGGVVDPNLRVYGVKGLRVVDAGTMPMLPTCHTQATTYAIAEKAADLIKEEDVV